MNILVAIIMKPVNWLCSFVFGVISFFILLFVAAALSVNFWLPRVLPMAVKSDSGFKLTVGQSESNIFTLNFNLFDVTIENGKHFPVPQFLTAQRFTVDFLLASIFGKKITIEDLVIDIPQLTHVKNENGQSNISEFIGETLSRKKKNGSDSKEKSKAIYVRHFRCKIGKVNTMDYSSGSLKTSEVNLNYEAEMSDISAENLLRRLGADLRSKGGLAVVQSLLGAMAEIPYLENAAKGAMRANGISLEGGSSRLAETGKSIWSKIKSVF